VRMATNGIRRFSDWTGIIHPQPSLVICSVLMFHRILLVRCCTQPNEFVIRHNRPQKRLLAGIDKKSGLVSNTQGRLYTISTTATCKHLRAVRLAALLP